MPVPKKPNTKPATAARQARRRARNKAPSAKHKPCLKDAGALRAAIASYFQWADENPWMKTVGVDKEGGLIQVPKTRPYLVEGLVNHLEMTNSHWHDIRNPNSKNYRADLEEVMAWCDNVLYTQKFTGAACEEFREGIISRYLGLGDRREITGQRLPNGQTAPIQVQTDLEVEHVAGAVRRKLLKD